VRKQNQVVVWRPLTAGRLSSLDESD
jgi:hypothetical protein